jgi:hypothetical protein
MCLLHFDKKTSPLKLTDIYSNEANDHLFQILSKPSKFFNQECKNDLLF